VSNFLIHLSLILHMAKDVVKSPQAICGMHAL